MDVGVLISLVQSYPELYNTTHPDYVNNVRRDQCWEEIGLVTKQTGAECRDRWVKLRDNYRKALQRRRKKSGLARRKIKPAKYEQELSFLTPYLADGDLLQTRNLPSDYEEEEQDEIEEPDDFGTFSIVRSTLSSPDRGSVTSSNKDSFTPVVSLSNLISSVKNPRSASYSKSETGSTRPTVETVAAVMENLLVGKQSEQTKGGGSADALTMFFMSMAKTVQRFPILDQIEVKKKIYQIVSDKEMDIALGSTSVEHP